MPATGPSPDAPTWRTLRELPSPALADPPISPDGGQPVHALMPRVSSEDDCLPRGSAVHRATPDCLSGVARLFVPVLIAS